MCDLRVGSSRHFRVGSKIEIEMGMVLGSGGRVYVEFMAYGLRFKFCGVVFEV